MDRCLQELDYCTPDGQGGLAGCNAGLSVETPEHAGSEHVLRRLVYARLADVRDAQSCPSNLATRC